MTATETKLFVGNLPFEITERELHDAFAVHVGVESVEIVRDRSNGNSRGFGFVTLISGADAQTAVDAMHGERMRDRELRVEVAHPREERRHGHHGGYGRRSRGVSSQPRA